MPIFDDPKKSLERMQKQLLQEEEEYEEAECLTEEEWFDKRPRSYNNKGVVDEYRRPKESFDVVKDLFASMKG